MESVSLTAFVDLLHLLPAERRGLILLVMVSGSCM